jgi:hypothetical protein
LWLRFLIPHSAQLRRKRDTKKHVSLLDLFSCFYPVFSSRRMSTTASIQPLIIAKVARHNYSLMWYDIKALGQRRLLHVCLRHSIAISQSLLSLELSLPLWLWPVTYLGLLHLSSPTFCGDC